MKRSEGKIWGKTGATSGIGAALADASAQAGFKEVAPVIHHILPSDIFIPLMSRHQVASDMASRQRHVCFTPAGSTGRPNTGVKSLCWGFKLQGLSGAFIWLTRPLVAVYLRAARQPGPPRERTSQMAL